MVSISNRSIDHGVDFRDLKTLLRFVNFKFDGSGGFYETYRRAV